MTIKPTTQGEYVAGLAPGLCEVGQRLWGVFHEVAPEAIEAIEYGMPARSGGVAPQERETRSMKGESGS